MNTPLLSDVAEEFLLRPPELTDKLPPAKVLLLMREHGWSALRAWRETNGLTQVEVANRLDLTLTTYATLENGMVRLCEWTAPFLESRLEIMWSIVWHAPITASDPKVSPYPRVKRRGRPRREPHELAR